MVLLLVVFVDVVDVVDYLFCFGWESYGETERDRERKCDYNARVAVITVQRNEIQ